MSSSTPATLSSSSPSQNQPSPAALKAQFQKRERIRKYLITYNAISGFFWAAVLLRFSILFPLVGTKFVSGGLNDFLRWVQTLMVLEVVHSALGLVRSPVVTTIIQVSSRLLVVWGVLYLFPEVGQSIFFSTCTIAWCITEIVRYTFYVYTLRRPTGSATTGAVPYWLTWIRYSAFYVLYPMGAGSEWLLILLSLPEAEQFSTLYTLFLKANLLIYIPGFYVMFTHVLKQRKKVLGGSSVNSGKRILKDDKKNV